MHGSFPVTRYKVGCVLAMDCKKPSCNPLITIYNSVTCRCYCFQERGQEIIQTSKNLPKASKYQCLQSKGKKGKESEIVILEFTLTLTVLKPGRWVNGSKSAAGLLQKWPLTLETTVLKLVFISIFYRCR